jgi:hypothetical protein
MVLKGSSSFSLDAVRAPQLKAVVGARLYARGSKYKIMNVHEEMFARSFITPDKKDRYLSLLGSRKGRKKIVDGLNHHTHLDGRYAHLLPSSQQNLSTIEGLLKQKGAPEICYIMSSDPDIDGKEMPLHEALIIVVASNIGTVVSCIAGRLGYFEFEDLGERYILER